MSKVVFLTGSALLDFSTDAALAAHFMHDAASAGFLVGQSCEIFSSSVFLLDTLHGASASAFLHDAH